jgi:hypothetical protein
VTHRGAGPDPGHPPNEWEFSNPRFNGQKRSQIGASAIDRVRQRYGWAAGLSTAAKAADLKSLQRLPRAHTTDFEIGERPWEPVSEVRDGGCRDGKNGALTCQGFHHFDRVFALPRLHDWASVPPP